MQINILEAKNRLSELVRAAQTGEVVILANRGRPVVKLVPVHPLNAGGTGAAGGVAAWLVAHPVPPHARRSAAEIDADLLREREGWD